MMHLRISLLRLAAPALLVAAVALSACGDDGPSLQAACAPACGPCQRCDSTAAGPACVDLCGGGLVCENDRCVAPPAATCTPACDACQTCDASGTTPVCLDNCGAGLECQDGECVAPAVPACSPACAACQTCDVSGTTPVCVDNCGDGLLCQDGACVAPAAVVCSPACGACQMCDTSGATPVCVDNCGGGMLCQNAKCVAPPAVVCDPACGACQMCDTSGATPVCVDNCALGLECQSGACVVPADPCGGACAACQLCNTDSGVPFCVDSCRAGQACDVTEKVCRPQPAGATFDHALVPALAGPFTADVAGGKAVTTVCLGCHAQTGTDMLGSAHFKWAGKTPLLQGHTSDTTVGKNNLVNNFCVAVPSNETRCSECHAGYGYNDKTFTFTDPATIDCLVCHSMNYAKHKTAAGAPAVGTDMALAAQTVGKPTRASCGRCHFFAGGDDNVKKGDLGTAMTNPTAAADVHMGAASGAFACASCHVASAHQIPGQGVHLPVAEGRLSCAECHGQAPHAGSLLNNHALDLACQTCHIPGFSRQQPTKMDWNWSTAGNRTRGTNGIETTTLADGTVVKSYDYMKGDFQWQKNVRPVYAWYDGRTTRMTLQDTFPAGAGTSGAPIHLGGPTASKGDLAAKIFPFKLMRGQQPVDTTTRKVLAPKLFGAGGFWATIPAAASYDPVVVENNWTAALTAGARYAGQIGAAESFTGRATGAMPWDWAYTDMYLGINHEVAPKAEALGCSSCHSGAAGWDWASLGYTCDPADSGPSCGSRH